MAKLLSLPRELRDQIWVYACERDMTWSAYGFGGSRRTKTPSKPTSWELDPITTDMGYPALESGSGSPHSLLRICRRACEEMAPILYRICCVSLVHPNQITRWLGTIGARNSSCICHLVIRFTSLLLKYNEEKYVKDRMLAWNSTLKMLPKLNSLTFDFERDPKVSMIWATLDDDMLLSDEFVGNELAIPTTASAKQSSLTSKDRSRERQPQLGQRPVTHAIIATYEAIPPLLSQYFAKLLELSAKSSLEQSVRGLPAEFFDESSYYLARTSAFDEYREHQSIAMSFGGRPQVASTLIPDLRVVFKQLPHLLYLRVGCRDIDSSFLAHVPCGVVTLDISFTDRHPPIVASRIRALRQICKCLSKLTITVSPLHDRVSLTQTGEELPFDRMWVKKETAKEWQCFWQALGDLKDSGVRVWEKKGLDFMKWRS